MCLPFLRCGLGSWPGNSHEFLTPTSSPTPNSSPLPRFFGFNYIWVPNKESCVTHSMEVVTENLLMLFQHS